MSNSMETWTDVSKEEMLAWLKTYPRRLERDVCGIREPSLVTYNDFTRGDGMWPSSIVASYHLKGLDPEEGYKILKGAEHAGNAPKPRED